MIGRWFKKDKLDLEFADVSRSSYINWPIQRAKDVKPITYQHQLNTYNKHKFPFCPGMLDYAQLGYIIPAWIDIHILANSAGVVQYIGSKHRGDGGFTPGRNMEPDIISGIFQPEDNVPLHPLIFCSPWSVFGNKNISALVMPPIYHANFLDDLYVPPGVVDYEKFHTINFVCVPKRKCEIHIKAGDPLIHVIPFYNKEINAGYGPASDYQKDKTRNEIKGSDKQYYRKYMMAKKFFGLNKEESN